MSADIADLDASLYEQAAEIIAGGQDHAPIMIVVGDNWVLPVLMLGATNDESTKNVASSTISMVAREPGVEVVAFIHETWRVVAMNGTPAADLYAAGVTPAHHPNRQECVTITYSLKDGARALVSHFIERPKEGRPRLLRGELVREDKENKFEGRFFADRPERKP